MYAIKQFIVTPTKEALITLLLAEEANRIKQSVKFDKVSQELTYYKRLLGLLALTVIVGIGLCVVRSYF